MAEDQTSLSNENARPGRYPRADRTTQRRNRLVRLGVLTLGLVIVTVIGIGHQLGWGKIVGADALCPFGGIETLWSLISSATYLKRIAASSVVLLGIVVVIGIVFRRSFCGYICPLGALQELFSRAGARLLGRRRPRMPAILDRPARYLKYAVLLVFVVWTWQAAELVMRPYDPWVAWMHVSDATSAFAEFAVGFVVLGISLAGSVVYDRFFCRYLCPMGAFLGIFSRVSIFKIRREAATCIDCKACDKACPVTVTVSTVETVNSPECIDCGECVNVCPVQGALVVTGPTRGGGRRIRLGTTGVLVSVIAIIAVGIGLTTAGAGTTFAWSTPSLAPLEAGEATASPSFDVEKIKGSMSFAEVSHATGIPPESFVQKFGVSEAEMAEPMKDFLETKGFDVKDDVRGWVQQQLSAQK